MRMRHLPLLVLASGLVAGFTAVECALAGPLQGVITTGGAMVNFDGFSKTTNTDAKSNTCTDAVSNEGGTIQTFPSPLNPDICSIFQKNRDPTKPDESVNGTGRLNQDKFHQDISGNIRPLPANQSTKSIDLKEISAGPPQKIASFWTASSQARAAGGFSANPDTYTATLSGSAQVKDQLNLSARTLLAEAASGAEDPFSFAISDGGSFTTQISLFGDEIASDDNGKPIDGLHILSTIGNSRNHFDLTAGFNGPVFLNGQPFSGELFRLVLESSDVVASVSDIAVSFAAWDGLGLSSQTIQDYDNYISSNLEVLPDGSIGLPAGSILPLIGAGTPFDPTITFGAGNVDVSLSIDESAQTVPEPSSASLLIAGLLATLSAPSSAHRLARRLNRRSDRIAPPRGFPEATMPM